MQTGLVNFVDSVIEAMTLSEIQTGNVDLLVAVAEVMTLIDVAISRGWIKINDNQAAHWGETFINIQEIADYGAFTFGGVPLAGNIEFTGYASNPIDNRQTPDWTDVDDGVPTTWTQIDNNQS